MRRAALPLFALALQLAGCGPAKDTTPPKAQRTYTFHALSGISMGAIGTAFLTGSGDHAKQIDAIGAMGGPLDAAYFLDRLEHLQMGGFCPYAALDDMVKSGKGDQLNDPKALDCMKPEANLSFELPQDFNHWRYTSNGGNFDRSEYLGLFWDLSLAMGNPLYYNPESPVFPAKEINLANFNQDLCTKPIVINNFYNKEYNPEGKYPVITFCDGQEPILYCDDANKTPVDYCSPLTPAEFCGKLGAQHVLQAGKSPSENPDLFYAKKGVYDPCYHHTEPVSFGLAVDFNGNGKRDYHEPIIANARERFQDVGKDGCADDKEDGKGGCTASGATGDPNGDDFDPATNPLGTERNFLHDDGEPYEDNGLDGVANTKDFGEGDGKYTEGPNRQRWLDTDFRQKYLAQGSTMPANIDVYADGGIRDLFNFGVSADMLSAGPRARVPSETKRFLDFSLIPAGPDGYQDGVYDAVSADYDAMGRNAFVRYGDVTVTEDARRAGNGDHVGTPAQLINRFGTYVKWMSHHWERVLGAPERIQSASRRLQTQFFSEKLGALRDFSIALPPGYDDPANAAKRYPVVFLMHGYGMDVGGMSDLNIIIDSFEASGDALPMIFVYPSGRCCHIRDSDGHKDCRDQDDQGNDLDSQTGWHKDCRTGTFFVNRAGFTPDDDTPYGESLFELMDYVDQHYRTLSPKAFDVPQAR